MTRRHGDIAERALAAGALQKTGELAALLDVAAGIKPRVIVEIGSDAGGTLYAWREAFPAAAVVAVTLQSGAYSTRSLLKSYGATVIECDSHDPETRERLVDILAGRPIDVLFIDGDHSYEGVSLDFEMYAPLVRAGGLVCFHDIVPHDLDGVTLLPLASTVGVHRLWRELRGRKREIVVQPATWGGIGVVDVNAAAVATLPPPGLRVVVPFVEGRLHAATREWGDAHGAEFRDVGSDRGAYFRLLRELWREGRGFMVVEQDIVPPHIAVRALASCDEPWCGLPYAYGSDDMVLAGHLGCTRLSARLLRERPGLVEESAIESLVIDRGGDDYEYLSLRIGAVLRRAGLTFHCHDLRAVHHHAPEDIWRQNARELFEVIDAMRRHRLEADMASRFGDIAASRRAEGLWQEARRLVAFMTSRVTPAQLAVMPDAVRVAIAEADA